jgi:hypothetical protein
MYNASPQYVKMVDSFSISYRTKWQEWEHERILSPMDHVLYLQWATHKHNTVRPLRSNSHGQWGLEKCQARRMSDCRVTLLEHIHTSIWWLNIPCQVVGLDRMSHTRGVGLQTFHCTCLSKCKLPTSTLFHWQSTYVRTFSFNLPTQDPKWRKRILPKVQRSKYTQLCKHKTASPNHLRQCTHVGGACWCPAKWETPQTGDLHIMQIRRIVSLVHIYTHSCLFYKFWCTFSLTL